MAAMVEAPAPAHNVGTDGQSYLHQALVTPSGTCLNLTAPALAAATDGLPQVTSSDASSVTPEASATPPPPPNPSQDEALIPPITSPTPQDVPSPPPLLGHGDDADWDVASIPPETAMKMLARAIEALAKATGDIPATPAASIMSKFSMGGGILESGTPRKENEQPDKGGADGGGDRVPALKEFMPSHSRNSSRPHTPTPVPDTDLRRPSFQPVSLTSPEATCNEPSFPPIPTPPADGDTDPEGSPSSSNPALEQRKQQPSSSRRDAQTAAIARKFFSKSIPPIAIDAYLTRLQRYCPMSTAVWLAAAHYIATLSLPSQAGTVPVVPVTPRTAHRLLLAALRVAMKALEDLRYPQARFAGVGGVAEAELKALEISVCYLMDFELQVDVLRLLRGAVKLQRAAQAAERMRSSVSGPSALRDFVLNKDALPLRMRQAREYH